MAEEPFSLISPAFSDGQPIPQQYSSSKGENVSPQLLISGVPDGAVSLALIMHDPDAVKVVGHDFLHWLVWDISTATASIETNSSPVGAIQGNNGAGKPGYIGPAPAPGTGDHHYIFELYALDKMLGLPASASLEQVEKTMDGHIIAQTKLTGLFSGD